MNFWHGTLFGILNTLFLLYLGFMLFLKGYKKREQELEKNQLDFLNVRAKRVEDAFSLLKKTELFFSFEIFLFLLEIPKQDLGFFLAEIFEALKKEKDKMLRDTNLIVLRSISFLPSGEREYGFQPLVLKEEITGNETNLNE